MNGRAVCGDGGGSECRGREVARTGGRGVGEDHLVWPDQYRLTPKELGRCQTWSGKSSVNVKVIHFISC